MFESALLAKVFAVLFAVSELLGMSDKIKANGVFQLIFNGLAKARGLFK